MARFEIPDACPHCGAPLLSEETYTCGSHWKLRWFWSKPRLIRLHQCEQNKSCADACMHLIADCINHNSQSRSHLLSDIQSENGKDFDDWTITVTRKTHRRVKRKR